MTSDEFALRLTGECAVLPGEHVLAAVSGGADSVALLCFLCEVKEQLDLTVSCVHVEHGIRGEASLRDMRFVGALCERKGIALHTVQVDAPSAARLRSMIQYPQSTTISTPSSPISSRYSSLTEYSVSPRSI